MCCKNLIIPPILSWHHKKTGNFTLCSWHGKKNDKGETKTMTLYEDLELTCWLLGMCSECGYSVHFSDMVIHWPILTLPNLPRVWSIMLSRMTRSWACCRYVWDWEDRQITHMVSWSWATRSLNPIKISWPSLSNKPMCTFITLSMTVCDPHNSTELNQEDWRKIINMHPKKKNDVQQKYRKKNLP